MHEGKMPVSPKAFWIATLYQFLSGKTNREPASLEYTATTRGVFIFTNIRVVIQGVSFLIILESCGEALQQKSQENVRHHQVLSAAKLIYEPERVHN